MTMDEMLLIQSAIIAAYPNYKPEDIKMTVKTWTAMLDEYSFREIQEALKCFILSDASGFAPTIGQLVALVHEIKAPGELSAVEAWALVSDAMRRSSYGSSEKYEELPVLCKKAIGGAVVFKEWMNMDSNTVQSVEKSHFIREYNALLRQKQELERMPRNVRERIGLAVYGKYEPKAAIAQEAAQKPQEEQARKGLFGWTKKRKEQIEELMGKLGAGA